MESKVYQAEYDDDNFEIIYACDDESAIDEAYSYCDEHGGLYEVFEINDDYEHIRQVF